MTKSILTTVALMFVLTISKAQTAMQFSGSDCNGNQVDLFADLDAGKAVVIEFYMASCGSCPPPAQKIQQMANNMMAANPGKIVKGYAFPFNNSTTCTYSKSWVTNNNLSMFFTPMDSGATQVAYYGGFGMPTIVLLGGTDHKVLFSTMSFSTSDTLAMRNKINALFKGTLGNETINSNSASFSLFPNPSNEQVTINFNSTPNSTVQVQVLDLSGKLVKEWMNEKQNGLVSRQFNTSDLANGNYLVRMIADSETSTVKLAVAH